MASLLEAIENKYGSDDPEVGSDLPIAIYVPKKSPRKCIPSLLVLNDCDIESAGDEQALDEKCQQVEELDLAQNKLSEWSEVFGILKHMPRIKFVNLSFNNLSDDIGSFIENNCFLHLKDLVLNGTRVDWTSVRKLLRMLPSLEELHLSLNEYSTVEIEDCGGPHTRLQKLHFAGNPVNSWREISKMGNKFPGLQALVLADCPIESLNQDHNTCDSTSKFASLQLLNLNNTLLSEWDDVDCLREFPALHCLRIQSCPLVEELTEHERRQLLIARLPNVQVLNGGGAITKEEREDAERAFIRFYVVKDPEERPRRFHELVAIHGMLEPLVHVDLSPEKKVKVIFHYGEKREARRIDVYQTVFELKQRLESFADGLPPHRMRLFYSDHVMRALQGPEEMKFPQKRLYSYNISSGDEIIVDSKT
ncbi:tubulin-specific chaperone cofactor E-like protein [Ischnura elegans]|uniref:tubulin-specific chaperone cofactor E-like protein n=1 Tax=Ischnura elegans TaxID=197161 RepID=UPI001ED86AF7|nr:tubulin-specific chaperone cofactor E-like protein [Ischnura elegans]XP_046383124.1 tubulin-specific chaperone cofactor E-like protein [Ischnura elegans]